MYSVVTANRNRLLMLVESVRTWQAAQLVGEIVVVDYGSDRPIESSDFASKDKIKVVRIESPGEWRPGLAFNIGVD